MVSLGGVDHYLGPYESECSRAEYDRLMAEYLAAGRRAEVVNRVDGVSVAQLLLAFLTHAESHYVKHGKPTSEVQADSTVIRTVRQFYGSQPDDSFGPLALKAVRQTWGDAGIVRTKVNQRQGRTVRIWKWGVSEELVRPETWQALKLVEGLKKGRSVAPESPPVLPVAVDVIQTTLPHLSPIVRGMIRLQLLTGMRPGEVCKLRPADIDRTDDVWEYRPVGHKTEHHERARVVYIGPQAKAILGPYLFRNPDTHCFSAEESREWYRQQAEAARVTPAHYGNGRGRKRDKRTTKKTRTGSRRPRAYFETCSYGKAIARGCDKAWPVPESIAHDASAAKAWEKLHHWSPNRIRHTHGTEIRKQFGLEAAQVILGHASADITQIYAERDAAKARDVIRQIGYLSTQRVFASSTPAGE